VEKPRKEEMAYPIWIDHKDKIVSFKYEEGFDQLHFPSQEEKLAFAIEICSAGYRIQ